MKKINAEELLDKYNAGEANAEEAAIVERWYASTDLVGALPNEAEMLEDQFQSKSELVAHMRPKLKLWKPISVAAAVLFLVGVGIIYNKVSVNVSVDSTIAVESEIAPGSDKAILVLANGKRIELTDARNGELAQQNGMKITKTADGQLVYQVSNRTGTGSSGHNTIETPKGGQYQVVLPDGSHVWLNASSTITYPIDFTAVKERRVILTGEAYFEVKKNSQKPFIVKTAHQEVKVLGTHFNINSYDDEDFTATTLLEGSVSVANGQFTKVIKPGEEARLKGSGAISISSVDTDATIGWKNGFFAFKRADLQMAMRQIARWYDVKVEYVGRVPEVAVTGKIYRNVTLQEVLKSIEYLDINLKLNGRKVIISSE